MRCKNCNVEVDFDTKVCPVCHAKMYNDGETLPSIYPKKELRKRPSKSSKFSFTSIYLACALTLSVIGTVLNLTLLPQIKWVLLLDGLLIYGYLLIHNTILSANTVGLKAFVQLIMLFTLFALSEIVVKDIHPETSAFWVLDIGLPVLLCISMLAVSISTLFVYRLKKALLLDIVWFSLLGYLPIILYACKAVTTPVASIVCCSLSTVLIIITCVLARKPLKDELMRHFHI